MAELSVNKKTSSSPVPHNGGSWQPTFPAGRLSRFNPFAMMREMTNEMDRMFHGAGPQNETQSWTPAMDVQCCNGNLQIAAELPGMRREDVKVEVTDDALVIEGERKQEHKEDHDGYHRLERSYGYFHRAIPLPEGAKTDQVKAELKDGVLKVSLPVPEMPKKAREIPVG